MISIRHLLTEKSAAEQAKTMGLQHVGFGNWQDPRTGKITYRTIKGVLTPVAGKALPTKTKPKIRVAKTKDDISRAVTVGGGGHITATQAFRKGLRDPEKPYGPPPKNAPDIRGGVIAGEFENTPFPGRAADLFDITYAENEKFLDPVRLRDELCRMLTLPEPAPVQDYSESGPAAFDEMKKMSENFAPYKYENTMRHMMNWLYGAKSSKKDFMNIVMKSFPSRVEFGRPLLRGLRIYGEFVDAFMEDYEVGNEFTFPESYSFTTDPEIASRFSAMANSDGISVIFRLFPTEDGKTSGIQVNAVAKTYKDVFEENKSDFTEETIKNIQESLDHAKLFSEEEEVLGIPGTAYRVIGSARVTPKREGFGNIMVIDIQELPTVAESAKPTKPKPINAVGQAFLTRPLNPKKKPKNDKPS